MRSFVVSKKMVGLMLAALIVVGACIAPNPEGLSQEAKMAVSLMFAGLALWITEAIPSGISALLLMALMPYFGIFDFSELWSKFMSSAWFFIMVSFALSAALAQTSIPIRVNVAILKRFGTNSSHVVFGFMLVSAIISMFCSNIATVAMTMSFTVELLRANGCKPRESRLGRCLVMGVVYGSIIGGCATLSGSSSHIMLLSLTEQSFAFSVSFLDWLIVSIPLVAVLLPVTWFTLIKIYKPENFSDEVIDDMADMIAREGAMPAREKAFCAFLIVLFGCWVASTWVPLLNLTTVSLIALAIMFLPGVEFLNLEGFIKGVSWNVLLVIGGVIALTAGIAETGGMTWVVQQVAPLFEGGNFFFIYLFSSVFVCLAHCLVPSGSATAGIAALPLMELARVTGANPTAIFHIIGWWAGSTFIMPIDSLMLLAYSYGYTEFKDPVKAGIVPTVTLILLSSTLTPFIINTFNIGMPLA